ncbi:hypothetical protein BGZ90_004810 [Linnemannia elongata]|nr:hypothetical protein BGZ90_004810 [Linnemannia elongata]
MYFGLPIFFNRDQEEGFWNKILKKIWSFIAMHSSRTLSVLCRAILLNSIILSRIWHPSWVVKYPLDFLQVKATVSNFVYSFESRTSGEVITTPRDKGDLGVIDPVTRCQSFQLKQIRNILATNISWGKDIILNIIQLITKTSHRLALLLTPLNGQYRSQLAVFSGVQRLATVTSSFPSFKAQALAASLPDSATLGSSPIEWWCETTDTTIKALRLRVEDLFQFSADDNRFLQLARQPHLTLKSCLAQAKLRLQAYKDRQMMHHSLQKALSTPPKITQGGKLAQPILSPAPIPHYSNPITLESATTKQLRAFLRQDSLQDFNSTAQTEARSSK